MRNKLEILWYVRLFYIRKFFVLHYLNIKIRIIKWLMRRLELNNKHR